MNIPDHDNLEFINDKIKEIDESFDLILMVENFQESMVLLKHEICWDYGDLASLRLNSHVDKTKSKIDQSAKEKLKEWLKTSYLFYDHFKVRFIIFWIDLINQITLAVTKKEARKVLVLSSYIIQHLSLQMNSELSYYRKY